MNTAIIYWSGTGNTEAMAHLVENGAKSVGAEVSLFTANEFTADMVEKFDSFAFGCPSMGAEELEETEFLPMFDSVRESLGDKKIGLFGSYGWGDGEWMRSWQESCRASGLNLVCDGVISNDAPDGEAAAKCEELGKVLAQ